MPKNRDKPPALPPFRLHHLIPAEAVPALEATPALPADQEMASWSEVPDALFPLKVAETARALAQQAWLMIEQATDTLSALPTVLEVRGAPEETAQVLEVMSMILLALPNRLAAGNAASVPHVDALLAWLINAPGRAGLIQQVLDALTLPDTSLARNEASTRYAAEREVLYRLHRALVTLQQQWDDLVSGRFPLESSSPQSARWTSGKAVPRARNSR
jgi:hypothetical protein